MPQFLSAGAVLFVCAIAVSACGDSTSPLTSTQFDGFGAPLACGRQTGPGDPSIVRECEVMLAVAASPDGSDTAQATPLRD